MQKVFDTVVFGAGVSGICAALQSARLGKKTLLVEKSGMPGGTITLSRINLPAIFSLKERLIISGIGWELLMKTRQEQGLPPPDLANSDYRRHWECYVEVDSLLFAGIAEEELIKAGVEIAYYTMASSLEFCDTHWSINLCSKDNYHVCQALCVIDCTGDADIVKAAGFACEAPQECQPGTLSIEISGVDTAALDYKSLGQSFYQAVQAGEVLTSDFSFGSSKNIPVPESCEHIFRHFFNRRGMNANHVVFYAPDQPGSRTAVETAGRAAMLRAWRFLRRQKGMENLRFNLVSAECGIRESRRITGEYCISENDYFNGKSFPDAICYSYYPIDLHDDHAGLIIKPLPDGVIPQIPRGALVPRGSRRLLAAGRIISSDRMANSALRTQATCMATGQAAGVLAALADKNNGNIMAEDIQEIRNTLKKHQAIVPES